MVVSLLNLVQNDNFNEYKLIMWRITVAIVSSSFKIQILILFYYNYVKLFVLFIKIDYICETFFKYKENHNEAFSIYNRDYIDEPCPYCLWFFGYSL